MIFEDTLGFKWVMGTRTGRHWADCPLNSESQSANEALSTQPQTRGWLVKNLHYRSPTPEFSEKISRQLCWPNGILILRYRSRFRPGSSLVQLILTSMPAAPSYAKAEFGNGRITSLFLTDSWGYEEFDNLRVHRMQILVSVDWVRLTLGILMPNERWR